MKNDLIRNLTRVRSDGGTRPCPQERLDAIKGEFRQLCTDAGASVNDRRALSEDIRLCHWENQSPDGRKHSTDDKPAFPFEGASDARIRLADGTVNEQVMILMAALMRANLSFRGGGVTPDIGARLIELWNHLMSHHLGVDWFVEWAKAAQWRQGDSPAVAFMQVWWHEETELVTEELTAEDFIARFTDLVALEDPEYAASPEAAGEIQALLNDPTLREELAGACMTLYPEMPEARAAKVARGLQERGWTVFPYPRVKDGRLCVKARRLFDDIFIPENTPTKLQRARIIYVREWVSQVELREREGRGEYVKGFVDAVLEHEGESGWTHYTRYGENGEYLGEPRQVAWDKNRQRGQYELITAYYKATNDDGVPGIYSVTYHHAVDFAGTHEELQTYKTGKYFFCPTTREILNEGFWQARGVCELAATDQQSLKLLHDSFMDHAQLCTVPPLTVPANRPKMNLVIGPLVQVKEQRQGEIRFMTMAQYPQSNDKVQQAIMDRHDRYHGRFSSSVPADLVRLYGENLVNFFLIEVNEAARMGLQIALQFMTDEQLREVWGEEWEPAAKDVRSIQNLFQVEFSFEASMLHFDYIKAVGDLITQYVLSWDTQSTIKREELVSWFMSAISPQLARRVLRPVEEANQAEIADEENNFAKIAAGVEPPMATSGQNFALRLEVELSIAERNPEAIAKLTPKSREIWEARVKHLQGMVMQEQNKLIGRTMARPALDGGAAA